MPVDYPEQSYYPSAKLRLIIRFDEFGDQQLKAKVPKKPIKNVSGVKDERNDLIVIADPLAPPGVNRLLVVGSGNVPASGPAQVQARSSDGLTFEVGAIIPHNAEWNQNGIRIADTANFHIRYVDLPIDPRTVRACAVEYYLGTVTADEFARGNAGAQRTTSTLGADSNAAEPLNVVPDTYTDANGVARTNLRFQGWVDRWQVEWLENAEPMIKIECRDNTSLIIGTQMPSDLNLSTTDPIDKAVALLLAQFPAFEGISVEYRPAAETPPKLSDLMGKAAIAPGRGVHQAKGGGAEHFSVWDFLTDVMGSIGHGVRVEGTTVVIQRTRSLTTSAAIRREDDPFQGRTLQGSGEVLQYRRMLYGRNVLEMRVARLYARNAPANIEVVSYDVAGKRVVSGRFPLPEDRQIYALPGDARPDQKWEVKRISGLVSDVQARIVAQEYYENQFRQELTVDVRTKNLASFGGDNEDPDLLDLKPGDTLEILVTRDDEEFSTLNKIEQALLIRGKAQDFLQAIGFSQDFAAAYAKAYEDANYVTAFRVRGSKFMWGVDDGITMTVQCVNYIEIKADASLAPGEEPKTGGVK